MLEIILIVLVLLFLTGNLQLVGVKIPHMTVAFFHGHTITLVEVLLFFTLLWAVSVLETPFREIAGVAFLLWLLSLAGIIAITGLANILLLAVIVGIVVSLVRSHKHPTLKE